LIFFLVLKHNKTFFHQNINSVILRLECPTECVVTYSLCFHKGS